ncbi:Nucleoside 5-triphosphatase RdgB (dHAPTP, dITP, XTP-specific), partial [hydrothermal vent metagenome]
PLSPEQRTARFVCVMALAAPPPSGDTHPGGTPSQWQTRRVVKKRHTDLLPHWEQDGAIYSITFCLLKGTLSDSERQLVLDACLHWHPSRLRVHIAVVMPDHVHMLFTPQRQADGHWPSLAWAMQSIKGFTGRRINELRGCTGRLWLDEYFDHIVRDEREYFEVLRYFADNPVRQKLAEHWLEYPFVGGEVVERHQTRGLKIPAPREGETRGLKGPAPAGWEDSAPSLNPRVLAITRGTFEGRIGLPGDVPRGENGFGYDPLFLVGPEFVRTSAELEPSEKNRLSHRGDAAAKMLAQLRLLRTRKLE